MKKRCLVAIKSNVNMTSKSKRRFALMKQAKKLASNEVTSNTMSIDAPIKTLEKSLLNIKERLSNQEFAMEALTQKLDKNSP